MVAHLCGSLAADDVAGLLKALLERDGDTHQVTVVDVLALLDIEVGGDYFYLAVLFFSAKTKCPQIASSQTNSAMQPAFYKLVQKCGSVLSTAVLRERLDIATLGEVAISYALNQRFKFMNCITARLRCVVLCCVVLWRAGQAAGVGERHGAVSGAHAYKDVLQTAQVQPHARRIRGLFQGEIFSFIF